MPVALVYLLGGLASLGALFGSFLAVILAAMFLHSHVMQDRVTGVVIGVMGLLLAALPILGLRFVARGRQGLGLSLWGAALVISTVLLVVLPGLIEAAARP